MTASKEARAWTYPVPPKTKDVSASIGDGEDLQDMSYRTVTIPLDKVDVAWETSRIIKSFMNTHGRAPEALLLGWKAALCLDAQVGLHEDTFCGIPVFSSRLVHPWGRSALDSAEPNTLLQYLSDEELPLGDG